jgi:hypothetical protein
MSKVNWHKYPDEEPSQTGNNGIITLTNVAKKRVLVNTDKNEDFKKKILDKLANGDKLHPHELIELVNKFEVNAVTKIVDEDNQPINHIQSIIKLGDKFFAINNEYHFNNKKYYFCSQPYKVINTGATGCRAAWKAV